MHIKDALWCFRGQLLSHEQRASMNVTTQCDDRFSRTKFDFAGTYKMGGGGDYSVETTRLVRTETRHDFLVHGDLLRASLYGRQG